MTTLIVLFRGINVGGRNNLPMKELVRVLESQGFENVRTYVQSGNAVAEYPRSVPSDLDETIAAKIEKLRGFKPKVHLLAADELKRAIESNPFREAEADPAMLHLFFLHSKPNEPDLESIVRVQAGSEQFHLEDRVFYLHTPDGFGRSKLGASAERYLGVPATARNWRTVMQLLEMATGA